MKNFFNTDSTILNINQLRIDKLDVNSIDLSNLNFKILSLSLSTSSEYFLLNNIHYNPQNQLTLNLYNRPYNVSFANLTRTTGVNTKNLTIRVEKI